MLNSATPGVIVTAVGAKAFPEQALFLDLLSKACEGEPALAV